MAAAAGEHRVCLTPVDGVNVTVHFNGSKGFELEWRDVRCLPSSSDADVSRNATPRAHTEAILDVQGLLKVILKIVFGEDKNGVACLPTFESKDGDMVLLLQHKTNRAVIQRVRICMDAAGSFQKSVHTDEELNEVATDTTPLDLLNRLGTLLSPEEDCVLTKPVSWPELPSELWSNVLKVLTKKEGTAVACTSQMIQQVITIPSFVWAPALLHVCLVQAADAVRMDTSTHLPINISDKEVRIGRSRRNDVVLLRDPEVSKKHCRIWRDARGNVYIQDLASTNGTKLNGEWLRPLSEAGPDSKAHSDPRRLSVGDIVVLGLTTLRLNDGAAPEMEPSSEKGEGESGAEGANPSSVSPSPARP